MTVDLSLFNNSITTMVTHLTNHYGEQTELETYVICVRVKGPDIPGGAGLNWIVGPDGDESAVGLLRAVLEVLDDGGGESTS